MGVHRGGDDDPPNPSFSASAPLGAEGTDLDHSPVAEADVSGALPLEVQDRSHDEHARFAGTSRDLKPHAGPQAIRGRGVPSIPLSMQSALAERPRELLISGHVNIDRYLSIDSFPGPDRTVPVRAHRAELGGTATNLALVASRLGVATGLVARIGDGFPEEFLTDLGHRGIDLRGVERVRGSPTPTCYILEDRNRAQRTLIEQGVMERVARAQLPVRILREYAWLHLTTADPGYQLRLMHEARRRGLHVSADPAQEIHYRWDRRSFRDLLEGSEILFGNRAEIDQALKFVGVRHPRGLLDFVPLVVRTEGRGGASAFSRAGALHVPTVRPARVRTLVGAGDAFRGGFYAAWFAGQPLVRCLSAGTRAGARWIEGRR